ncbi:alpha/beta fold hydrolase [Microbacterium sp. NPDC077644]|uniref:alpha/beta fold hydrolase n=1 Tax=Microbacterium sp. NPDC077644 TaxID=3155055 RepID=UPI00345088AE
MTQQNIVDTQGRRVSFVEEGEGPVSLVLVSARDLDGDGLGVVAHYLAEEAGFHVIRVSLQTEYAVAATDDLLALLDGLGLDDTWIGGHGFGGTVARAFAAAHTDRVNGLLLLGAEDDDTPLAPAIPVLIVQGSEDTVTPPANGERLQATAPERASVKSLEGADHFFPVTHPIETAVIIEEYLDWD